MTVQLDLTAQSDSRFLHWVVCLFDGASQFGTVLAHLERFWLFTGWVSTLPQSCCFMNHEVIKCSGRKDCCSTFYLRQPRLLPEVVLPVVSCRETIAGVKQKLHFACARVFVAVE